MTDLNVRVWTRPGVRVPDWRVSYGASATMQELDRMVNQGLLPPEDFPPPRDCVLTWDEALETVSLALISPGSLGGRLLSMEAPLGYYGGWSLALEIVPGLGEFRVRSRSESWDRLTLGEALAVFVHQTYDSGWKGFKGREVQGFSLQAAGAFCV